MEENAATEEAAACDVLGAVPGATARVMAVEEAHATGRKKRSVDAAVGGLQLQAQERKRGTPVSARE